MSFWVLPGAIAIILMIGIVMASLESDSNETPTTYSTLNYAGFWRRFAALLIDTILLTIPMIALLIVWMVIVALDQQQIPAADDFLANNVSFHILSAALTWLYFATMESSRYQGTLGKILLKIKVTDLDGQRIGFWRATGRHFGKLISSVILTLGYIMAGFTKRKQALHDIMSGCLVVRSDEPNSAVATSAHTLSASPPPLPAANTAYKAESPLQSGPDFEPLQSSQTELPEYSRAQVALTYRPEVAKIWQSVKNLPANASEEFLAMLESKPQTSEDELLAFYNAQTEALVSPFSDPEIDRAYSRLRGFPEAEQEFRRAVEVLGTTIQADNIAQTLLERIAEAEYEAWQTKSWGRYTNANGAVVIVTQTQQLQIEIDQSPVTIIQPGHKGYFARFWAKHAQRLGLGVNFKQAS